MSKIDIINYFLNEKEIFEKKNCLIKDERAFSEDFIPSKIINRDKQLNTILGVIKDFIYSKRGTNMLFYGNTGTGKTLIARYIAYILKNNIISKKKNIKVIYINCKSLITKEADYYIIGKIYNNLTSSFFKKGKRKYEMLEDLFRYLSNNDVKLILFLDEFDSLFYKKNNEDLLYMLLRDFDINTPLKASIVLISNNITFINNLDPRIKSSLSSFLRIDFPPYDANSIREILTERAKLALKENSIDQNIINYIAAKVTKYFSGDARVAINILKLSAIIADSKNKSSIEKEDVDEAFENMDFDVLKSIVYSLTTTQKILLLSLIKLQEIMRDSYISFEKIYEKYCEISQNLYISPLSRSTIFKNMKNLEMILGNFLESKTLSEGKKGGYKRIYKLLMEEKDMKKLYTFLTEKILNV